MQTIAVLAAFLLVAGVAAEQPQEVSNVQTVPAQSQSSHVTGHTSSVESGPQQGGHQQHFTGGQVVGFEQQAPPQYYSPSGLVQVVGQQGAPAEGQQAPAGAKPVVVKHYAVAGPEQYGQPESASIPPNYKPFGSWGLYIGGNPADGYYSNYYKALSSSVSDKQAVGGESPVKPVGSQSFVGQASGFGSSGSSSFYKQGPTYPQTVAYQDQGYQGYPYGEYYTPADLNSGSRVQVQNQVVPSVYSSGFAPEYQQPAAFYAADSYAATKRAGQQFAQKEVQAPLSPAKGYQQQQQQQQQQLKGYGYGYSAQSAYQSPVAVHQASAYQQQQPQVVAYPVPVGSQLVGSQPGVEGAFQPYGVHGFTRYAVKPTVVGAEQSYYHTGVHSAPASQFPVYKQQFAGHHQPLSFYGYPLSQLHYSSAVAPAFGTQNPGAPAPAGAPSSQGPFPAQGAPQSGPTVVEHSGPVAHSPAAPVEALSSEKSETSSEADKQANKPQQ